MESEAYTDAQVEAKIGTHVRVRVAPHAIPREAVGTILHLARLAD